MRAHNLCWFVRSPCKTYTWLSTQMQGNKTCLNFIRGLASDCRPVTQRLIGFHKQTSQSCHDTCLYQDHTWSRALVMLPRQKPSHKIPQHQQGISRRGVLTIFRDWVFKDQSRICTHSPLQTVLCKVCVCAHTYRTSGD